MDDLDSLKADLLAAAEQAPDLAALEELRVRALGKKGSVTGLMKALGKLDPESRKVRGQDLRLSGSLRITTIDMLALWLLPRHLTRFREDFHASMPALEEAAENLGCTGLRRFCKVTLPLIRS